MGSIWTILNPRKSEQKMGGWAVGIPRDSSKEFPRGEERQNLYTERTDQILSTMDENTPVPRHILVKY